MSNQTIYALSTIYGKSGVAVIRVSGNEVLNIISQMTDIDVSNIKARHAYFTSIKKKDSKELLDRAVVIYFKSPNSFTGEDIVEIQCHGSKAVLSSILKELSLFENIRLAEPGEFSKRSFYNKKMDLTEAEGLADLIDAETEAQHKYALQQMEGNLRNLYSSWRSELVKVLSYLEAYIDFPEEEISEDISKDVLNTVFKVEKEIKEHLKNNNVNERLRNGFRIVISGETNAGKSSLINAFAKRNAVIVSDIEGTTRDAIDINLDIDGYPVIITDTAGIRETDNPIEKQGIDIAKEKIQQADIVLALYDATKYEQSSFPILDNYEGKVIYIANKIDKLSDEEKKNIEDAGHICISAKFNIGLAELTKAIADIIKDNFASVSNPLITRERYRIALEECLKNLQIFSLDKEIELAAEDIRLACREIGKITGNVEVDEILDKIFGSFCIGK